MEKKIRRGWCGPCHIRCGLLVELENGKAVKVKGDPEHPVNRGQMCARGNLILEHLYHPDRLNYPLKRIGQKGEGKWERIPWEKALDEIADRLMDVKEEYGPESLAFTHGTYRTYGWPIRRFFNLFVSPNICGANQICRCPSWAVEFITYGVSFHSDLRNTACAVLWGRSPSKSCIIPEWLGITGAKKRGAKIIVVDPKATEEAKIADIWLQVRPGTDLFLMMAWLHVIIGEELYDKEFVEKRTFGFDKLKEHVKPYTPERAAEVTWVPKEKILEAARLYAATKPAVLTWGLGIDKQGINATQAARAKCMLHAVTGNLDVKGGELLGRSGDLDKVISDTELELNEKLPKSKRDKLLGGHEYRLFSFSAWEMISEAVTKLPKIYTHPPNTEIICTGHARHLWDAIITEKPYPVKALISQADNPLLSLANTKLVYQALRNPNLELYVVMDYYMTPSAQLADYVLPAAGTLERSDLQDQHGFANFCLACPKAMEPLYERRDDYDFWRGLGIRTGQKEFWPWQTIEEACDYRLEPLGIKFQDVVDRYGIFGPEEYKKYEKYGFGTPSGKVELYSTIMERLGYDPLPNYKELPEGLLESPELAKEYPFTLVTGERFMPMYHSELRQIPSARKINPDPIAEIHPDIASSLGIVSGDWVFIETPMGRIRQKARLTPKVHPKVVHIEHGWWFPEKPGEEPSLHGLWESNANVICPDDPRYCSPEIGSWPHSALLCRIGKEG